MVWCSADGCSAPKLLNIDAMKFSRQSCQAWGIYILLDVYANTLRYVEGCWAVLEMQLTLVFLIGSERSRRRRSRSRSRRTSRTRRYECQVDCVNESVHLIRFLRWLCL
jgi:hypothetical protein